MRKQKVVVILIALALILGVAVSCDRPLKVDNTVPPTQTPSPAFSDLSSPPSTVGTSQPDLPSQPPAGTTTPDTSASDIERFTTTEETTTNTSPPSSKRTTTRTSAKKTTITTKKKATTQPTTTTKASAPAKTTTTTTVAVNAGSYNANFESEVIKLVNAVRAKEGLAPLKLNTSLRKSARVRAEEISRPGQFSHTRPDGREWKTAIAFSYSCAGENIAMGHRKPADVMNDWMESQGHRDNILGEINTDIGVGCYEESGTLYWVQLFAKPR